MTERPPQQRAEVWSACAQDYEDWFVPVSRGVASEALDRLAPRAAGRLLDVAAGTGALTLEAARRGARVTAVDFAPRMLALLRRKLAAAGLDGVETREMDGQALGFGDGSFETAASNLGLVFFPEPDRGLAELHRVLAPGGRACVTSISTVERSPLMQTIARALLAGPPGSRPTQPPAAFALSTPDEMHGALEKAGFREIRVETVSVQWDIADPARFWDGWALSAPPTALMMATLTPEAQRAAGREFVRLVREELGDGPPTFPTAAVVGVGVR